MIMLPVILITKRKYNKVRTLFHKICYNYDISYVMIWFGVM